MTSSASDAVQGQLMGQDGHAALPTNRSLRPPTTKGAAEPRRADRGHWVPTLNLRPLLQERYKETVGDRRPNLFGVDPDSDSAASPGSSPRDAAPTDVHTPRAYKGPSVDADVRAAPPGKRQVISRNASNDGQDVEPADGQGSGESRGLNLEFDTPRGTAGRSVNIAARPDLDTPPAMPGARRPEMYDMYDDGDVEDGAGSDRVYGEEHEWSGLDHQIEVRTDLVTPAVPESFSVPSTA